MARKEFQWQGMSEEELKQKSVEDILPLIPSRARRSLQRGFDEQQQSLLDKLAKGKDNVKTHARDMVIIPQMIGKTIKIYRGNEWVSVKILPEMIGQFLGEFSLTRRSLKHSNPGVGATKSSSALSVR